MYTLLLKMYTHLLKMYMHLLSSTLIKILISIKILVATFLPAFFPGEVIYRIF